MSNTDDHMVFASVSEPGNRLYVLQATGIQANRSVHQVNDSKPCVVKSGFAGKIVDTKVSAALTIWLVNLCGRMRNGKNRVFVPVIVYV